MDRLPRHGWGVSEVKDSDTEWNDLEWWEDEVWTLESVWSPKTPKVYLTFLVDPQISTHGRKKGEGVWAVKASLKRLSDWKDQVGVVFLALGRGWEKGLPDFLRAMDELRNGRGEE